MDKAPTSLDSTHKLHEAIRKLEAYSLQQTETEVPSVSRTISLMRSILVKRFDFQLKEHQHNPLIPDHHEILMAIELINRNRFFIEKLREGTLAEQELAERITQVINSYNDSCDKRIQRCVSGRERLAHFFLNDRNKSQHLPKIALPKKITVQCHYSENPASVFMHTITSKPNFSSLLSKQSAELFHMKAITLLESFYGTASSPEERMSIKNSPIHVDIDENASICILTQTLSLFPGQTIIVKGNSSLNPITRAVIQLLPDSFCLVLEQASFPHPIQRAGWSVASQLLPEFPQRIDLLNEAAELFQRRNQMVIELSSKKGTLISHAKKLLSLKKKAFNLHSRELIDLHKMLAKSVLNAASVNSAADKSIKQFFETLYNHSRPLEALADASQTMREYFMTRPHQTLLNVIIKGGSTELGSTIAETRYATAKNILDKSIDEAMKEVGLQKAEAKLPEDSITWDYVACMGEILGRAANQIYLQYLSEDLMYPPPCLTPFEYKVQAAAYSHLKDFLNELALPSDNDPAHNLESAYELLKHQILSDTAIFQNESHAAISRELADYFQNRYLSLNAI